MPGKLRGQALPWGGRRPNGGRIIEHGKMHNRGMGIARIAERHTVTVIIVYSSS